MATDWTRSAQAFEAAGTPDPQAWPEAFDGVLARRLGAYLIDLCCIGLIAMVLWLVFATLTIVSFGLLGPLLWFVFGLIPLAYHTLLLSGRRAATWGMRLFDLELRSWTGERPGLLQALAQTAVFYTTVSATGSLILLFALVNRRMRTLHDVLVGTLMLRASALAYGPPRRRWPG